MEIKCIVIISALALELFFKPTGRFKGFKWFIKYRDWVISLYRDSINWNGVVGVLSVIVIPFILILILQVTVFSSGSYLGIPAVLFGIVVLVYCLRYHILNQVIEQLSDKTAGQSYGKNKEAIIEVMGNKFNPSENNNEVLSKAVFVQANDRMYSVLFWFLILGPAGAILYRMSSSLAKYTINSTAPEIELDDFDSNAKRLFGILSWIPARLSAAGYALAGSFEDAINHWQEVDTNIPTSQGRYNYLRSNEDVLYKTGAGAIDLGRYYVSDEIDPDDKSYMSFDGVRAAQGLVLRTLLIWAAVVVLILLASWVS